MKRRTSSSEPTYKLQLKRADSITEVLAQEWSKEGAWGVWKGSNATFVYTVLQKTLESWIKGVLSALLNIPDSVSLGVDSTDSPNPWASLGVAVAAGAMTGLLLAPLDLVRIK